jgi:hypothetical protein
MQQKTELFNLLYLLKSAWLFFVASEFILCLSLVLLKMRPLQLFSYDPDGVQHFAAMLEPHLSESRLNRLCPQSERFQGQAPTS